jgi:hypothetical protein
MRPSASIMIAVSAGLVLIGFLYARSGHHPPEGADQVQQPVASGKLSARQQVAQRLQQLHAAHDRPGQARESAPGAPLGGAPRGPLESGARAARNPDRALPPRPGAPAAAAPDAGASETEELDVDPDDIPGLKTIALRDADPERRLAAVTMLGASEDPAVLPTLEQALSDEDEEVRMAAIQSLADFTGDAPIDLLAKVVVSDPSADNRYEALQTLSDIGGERATSAIQKALNDPDEDVRSLAEGMLDTDDTYEGDSPDTAEAPTPTSPQPPSP